MGLILRYLAVFCSVFLTLFWVSTQIGVIWDEPIYFQYADQVLAWWRAGASFDPQTVSTYWHDKGLLRIHPPLFKLMIAGSHHLFGEHVPFPMDHRMGHLLLEATLLTLCLYLFMRLFSWQAALLFWLCTFLQPRVFGDLLVAATDGISALVWLASVLTVACMGQASTKRSRWLLSTVLIALIALGLNVKFTAVLVVVPLVIYALWARDLKLLISYGLGLGVGLCVYVACSPLHLLRPGWAIKDFLLQPFQRLDIPVWTFYAGQRYVLDAVPVHYFFVMSAITFPVILVWGVLGWKKAYQSSRPIFTLLSLALAFWILLECVPSIPKYDGVRQFAPFFPVLGWACAWGCYEVSRRFRAVVMLLLPVILGLSLYRAHPYYLSYYNALIGGLPGATAKGMEVSYWFEPLWPHIISDANTLLPQKAKLAILPAWKPILSQYQMEGLLRSDLILQSSAASADYLILARRRSLVPDEAYLKAPAMSEVIFQGVSMAKLIQIRSPSR